MRREIAVGTGHQPVEHFDHIDAGAGIELQRLVEPFDRFVEPLHLRVGIADVVRCQRIAGAHPERFDELFLRIGVPLLAKQSHAPIDVLRGGARLDAGRRGLPQRSAFVPEGAAWGAGPQHEGGFGGPKR